jgi:hypothetical protein
LLPGHHEMSNFFHHMFPTLMANMFGIGQRVPSSQLNMALLKTEGQSMGMAVESHIYQEDLLPLQLTCLLEGHLWLPLCLGLCDRDHFLLYLTRKL